MQFKGPSKKKNAQKVLLQSDEYFKAGAFAALEDHVLESNENISLERADFTLLRKQHVEEIIPASSLPIEKVCMSQTHSMILLSDGRLLFKAIDSFSADTSEKKKRKTKTSVWPKDLYRIKRLLLQASRSNICLLR